MADDLLAQQNPLYAQLVANQLGQGQQPGGLALPATLQARLASALAQQKEGLDTSPIRSGWQGLARMANAALGGYGQYKAEQEAAHIPHWIDTGGGMQAVDQLGRPLGQFIPKTMIHDVKAGDVSAPIAITGQAGGGFSAAPLSQGGPPGVQGTAPAAPVNPIAETIRQGGRLGAEVAGMRKSAEEAATQNEKYYASLHKGLSGSAMIASQQKQNIDILKQIAAAPNFTPGAGSESAQGLQRLAAQFGINPQGAAPRELFNQVAARVLADQFSGIRSMAAETGEQGGRIFQSMLKLEEAANFTPNDSLEGIKAKINLIDKAGDLMMRWADKADDYAGQHGGRLDSGFDKTIRREIAGARIPNAVPQVQQGPQFSFTRDEIEAERARRAKLQQQ